MSQEAFAGERGVTLKTLARYVTRFRKQKAKVTSPRWVAAEVAGPGESIAELAVVLPGGHRIEVKRGFDASTLRQLMAALERG